MKKLIFNWLDRLSDQKRANILLYVFGKFKVPMLGYIRPKVISMTDSRCVVVIPLKRRTRNHVRSMYFGVLAAGADCAAGILAMMRIWQSKKNIQLLFKDFEADFLKRAQSDVHFICEEGAAIDQLIQRAIETKERQNEKVSLFATTPETSGDEVIAKFTLTISVKWKE